jgi:16S rRNA (guanine(966)-N(2))-methyltransferase RsmD
MLKITGGIYKGKFLKFPKNIRVTSSKVREGLFNILNEKLFQAQFLEIFAGSGVVGIEALSRGVEKVIFIEKNRNVAKIIKENLKITNLKEKAEIIIADAIEGLKFLKNRKEKFDIVFLDPPYKKENLLISTLKFISSIDIFRKNCIIIIEHYKKIFLEEKIGILEKKKVYEYGDTLLSFYTVKKEI